jgi:hypothetical protein
MPLGAAVELGVRFHHEEKKICLDQVLQKPASQKTRGEQSPGGSWAYDPSRVDMSSNASPKSVAGLKSWIQYRKVEEKETHAGSSEKTVEESEPELQFRLEIEREVNNERDANLSYRSRLSNEPLTPTGKKHFAERF